ncbi:MAG: hypothetical protein JWM34_1088 [Ilumatobacteraceae bacterium]|nr:hypothetical protein [Ilumatobacteraceae bacterium]
MDSWVSDVEHPLIHRFESLAIAADAAVRRWSIQGAERRRAAVEVAKVERTAAVEHRDGFANRLKAAVDEFEGTGLGGSNIPHVKALIGRWLVAPITVAAAAADYVVLSTVFENVDTSESKSTAQVLAICVSLLIMLGGTIVGKALWRHNLIPDGQEGRKGERVFYVVLGAALLLLTVLIAIMRASVSEQDPALHGFGLSTRMASGLGFVAIQTSAYLLAVVAAYYGHRADSTKDDGYFVRARLRSACSRANKRVTEANQAVVRCEHDLDGFEKGAEFELELARAEVADAFSTAFAVLCARQGLGAYHGAELAGEHLATLLRVVPGAPGARTDGRAA